MKTPYQLYLPILIAALVVAFCAACSDDIVDSGKWDLEDNLPDRVDPPPPDDCDDDETFHPITEECVPIDPPPPPPPEECGTGAIEGAACRPDGAELPGADVTISGQDCHGDSFAYSTVTDELGYYHFSEIPAGLHTVTVSSGSFDTSADVVVYEDEVRMAPQICLQGGDTSVAIIHGEFDDVGTLLEGIGIDFDYITEDTWDGEEAAAFFSDLSAMLTYDIIFVECGGSWSNMEASTFDVDMDQVASNIAEFVERGNSLYASDQAQPYIQESLNAIEFYNEDDGITGPQVGISGDLQAEVLSPEMQNVLGATTAELYFELAAWTIAVDVEPSTEVHIQGDAETTAGEVIENSPLMSVYSDPSGEGRAIYTSFHTTATSTADMQDILEFMIFQL